MKGLKFIEIDEEGNVRKLVGMCKAKDFQKAR